MTALCRCFWDNYLKIFSDLALSNMAGTVCSSIESGAEGPICWNLIFIGWSRQVGRASWIVREVGTWMPGLARRGVDRVLVRWRGVKGFYGVFGTGGSRVMSAASYRSTLLSSAEF